MKRSSLKACSETEHRERRCMRMEDRRGKYDRRQQRQEVKTRRRLEELLTRWDQRHHRPSRHEKGCHQNGSWLRWRGGMWQKDQFELFSQVTTRSRSTMTYCTPKDTWRIQNPVIFRYLSVSKLDSHPTFPHRGHDLRRETWRRRRAAWSSPRRTVEIPMKTKNHGLIILINIYNIYITLII